MWEPRRLTALSASTACCRDSFTLLYSIREELAQLSRCSAGLKYISKKQSIKTLKYDIVTYLGY
jgi:hypothetical protein